MTVEGATYEERAARGARSQSLFRDVNERVREIDDVSGHVVSLGDWMCECASDDCNERIRVTTDEYESVRANATRFLIAPDKRHVFAEIEDVVEQNERFVLTEKVGRAGDVHRLRNQPRVLRRVG